MDRRRADAMPTASDSIIVRRLRDEADRYRTNTGMLHSLLADVLGDDERLTRYAEERSYHHPNGFAKITLREPTPGTPGLRLHIWPERGHEPAVPTDPHAHRWAFASWIIAGSLHEVTFREADDEAGDRYDRYEYTGSLESTHAPAGAPRTLHEIEHHLRTAGDIYVRHRHEIHSVESGGGMPAASLVVREPDENPATPVYQRSGALGDSRPIPIRPAELRSILENVCAILRPAT